jgi:hypothetical protein
MSALAEWSIVGCGIAGVTCQDSRTPTRPETELVLLSSVNHFVFKPLPEWEG